jgi:hypothetical protein
MTDAQRRVLQALPGTVGQIARRTNLSVMVATHILDGLYRRSWATIDQRGRWRALERGLKKV